MYLLIAESKTNEVKELSEDILGKRTLSRKRERKEDLETLLWIFTCSYTTNTAFLYIISHHSQQI